MGRGFEFKLQKGADWAKTKKLIQEWEFRFEAYLEGFVAQAAKSGLDELKGRAPNAKEMGGAYKSALKVKQVKGVNPVNKPALLLQGKELKTEGLPKMQKAAAIVFEGKLKQVRDKDPDTTILEVRPKPNKKKKHPATFVLERNNPWTTDTLPWVPPRKDADLVYIAEDKAKVSFVRQKKKRKLTSIIRRLRRKGVRLKSAKQTTQVAKTPVKADIAKMALMFEFGIGRRPKPHWRPMVKAMRKKIAFEIAKRENMVRTMTDPQYRGWMRLGNLKDDISLSDVESFNEFQNKVN